MIDELMHDGYVYALRRTDGAIKIGTTQNLAFRRRELEERFGPLEFVMAIPGSRRMERYVHTLLADWRITGEWFDGHVGRLLELVQAGSPCALPERRTPATSEERSRKAVLAARRSSTGSPQAVGK